MHAEFPPDEAESKAWEDLYSPNAARGLRYNINLIFSFFVEDVLVGEQSSRNFRIIISSLLEMRFPFVHFFPQSCRVASIFLYRLESTEERALLHRGPPTANFPPAAKYCREVTVLKYR